MLGNIFRRSIKTGEIKNKKTNDLSVLNVKGSTHQLELKDIEVGEETEVLLKELNSLDATNEPKEMLNF